MKFLRKVFTNGIIGLICVMLAIFGVGMGLLTWRGGDLLFGILYALGGIGFLVLAIIVLSRDDNPPGPHGRPRW